MGSEMCIRDSGGGYGDGNGDGYGYDDGYRWTDGDGYGWSDGDGYGYGFVDCRDTITTRTRRR